MNRKIHRFLAKDHKRLDELLAQAIENPDEIDQQMYHKFRIGLLKHIKMEEKILFPTATRANNSVPLPMAAKLKLDHGALAALTVLPPSREVVNALTYILIQHDKLEEKEGGMYDLCERLTENETDEILAQLKATTEVPVNPFNGSENALQAAKNALSRAGFDYDVISKS